MVDELTTNVITNLPFVVSLLKDLFSASLSILPGSSGPGGLCEA